MVCFLNKKIRKVGRLCGAKVKKLLGAKSYFIDSFVEDN